MTKDRHKILTGRTWVVVASASRAEIYTRELRHSQLELSQCLTEPDAGSKEREIAADAPGRAFDSHSQGRHAMEPTHSSAEQLRVRFAHRVAATIDAARKANHFQRLVIIAAPSFLGILRGQLSEATRNLVTAEINKQMSGQEPADIATLIDVHAP